MFSILIVDHNLDYSSLLKTYLEEDFFNITIMNSTTHALRVIDNFNQFDAIICAYNTPEINCLEFFETIKPKTKRTKFIGLFSLYYDLTIKKEELQNIHFKFTRFEVKELLKYLKTETNIDNY